MIEQVNIFCGDLFGANSIEGEDDVMEVLLDPPWLFTYGAGRHALDDLPPLAMPFCCRRSARRVTIACTGERPPLFS